MSQPLTEREVKVLFLASQGNTRKDISLRINRTPETVKFYLRKISQKLNARNTVNAVYIASRRGFI